MAYSNQTVAQLCRVLGTVVNTHAEMELLFLEHELSYSDVIGGLRPRANALVMAVRQRPATEAEQGLTRLIEYVLERAPSSWDQAEELLRALRVDGFEWRSGRLVPTTPSPARLADELSQLELDLQELGLRVASEHYRQAYESFVAGNWEAANGQIRSFVEDLFIELGKQKTSIDRSNPAAALQDLRDATFFDNPEWQIFRGFWQCIQDNGPHRGLSHEQEALFRLHVATAVARYAIHKARTTSTPL